MGGSRSGKTRVSPTTCSHASCTAADNARPAAASERCSGAPLACTKRPSRRTGAAAAEPADDDADDPTPKMKRQRGDNTHPPTCRQAGRQAGRCPISTTRGRKTTGTAELTTHHHRSPAPPPNGRVKQQVEPTASPPQRAAAQRNTADSIDRAWTQQSTRPRDRHAPVRDRSSVTIITRVSPSTKCSKRNSH
jgi:hypothetical protein